MSGLKNHGNANSLLINAFWEVSKNSTKNVWYFSFSLLLFVLIDNQLPASLCFPCVKTNRTPFQCLQKYQIYNKDLKRKEWTKDEDQMLLELVQEMRVGSHIPYKKSKWRTFHSPGMLHSPILFSLVEASYTCLEVSLYQQGLNISWNLYPSWKFGWSWLSTIV